MKTTWSKDRPVKPVTDPMLKDLLPLLHSDKRSTFAKANVSGLSSSTILNWQSGKVNRPQCMSIQMAYRMLGYELKPIAIGNIVQLKARRA